MATQTIGRFPLKRGEPKPGNGRRRMKKWRNRYIRHKSEGTKEVR